ncbi:MAG: hypothetical protein JXR37_09175 [Kiritimatiellae bacterium]|nr:hypothetical protein [Kiritimatiellia bacterium]
MTDFFAFGSVLLLIVLFAAAFIVGVCLFIAPLFIWGNLSRIAKDMWVIRSQLARLLGVLETAIAEKPTESREVEAVSCPGCSAVISYDLENPPAKLKCHKCGEEWDVEE